MKEKRVEKQLKRDQQNAANVQMKEKRVALEKSLTLDQLCKTQQIKGINKKQPMFEQRREGLLSKCQWLKMNCTG